MLLAIETSSLVSSVALLHEDTLRAELTIQARLTHSEQLMPHIADMLDKASVKKSQIDGVAVAVGPGSFTGLRIGLATGKGLSVRLQDNGSKNGTFINNTRLSSGTIVAVQNGGMFTMGRLRFVVEITNRGLSPRPGSNSPATELI